MENADEEEKSVPADVSDSDSFDELPVLASFSSVPILPSMKADCQPDCMKDATQHVGKVTIQDFKLLRALSHGAYGKVCLT